MHDELGFKSVFIGIGNPQPKTIPIFEGLTEQHGYYTSKSFLPKVKSYTLGHNFINFLLTAFTLIDPKSIKRH
jgi:hypothetical protein